MFAGCLPFLPSIADKLRSVGTCTRRIFSSYDSSSRQRRPWVKSPIFVKELYVIEKGRQSTE